MTSTNRRDFIGALAAVSCPFACRSDDVVPPPVLAPTRDRDLLQREIDEVPAGVMGAYLNNAAGAEELIRRYVALARLDAAFEKVMSEVKTTVVTDRPAVWFVYNMGVVVKTCEALFSIDLCHRRACEIAPLLDFAIISHNHTDHYTKRFYGEMDGRLHKTVINNFTDNYGAAFNKGVCGFSRGKRTFRMKDVTIRTYESDHNEFLRGFTMPVEVECNGYSIFHVGDTHNVDELKPSRRPDLWIHHAYCWGQGPESGRGAAHLKPRVTVVAHLQELQHPRGCARWTWKDGEVAKAAAEKAGSRHVLVPLWGDRIM